VKGGEKSTMRADNYNPAVKFGARWYPDNLVVAPPTKGEYYFVDAAKSAGQGGKSWEDAFSTIQAAVNAASKDDVIFVAPVTTDGYYSENVLVGGTAAKEYGNMGLKIIGTGGHKNVRIRASAGTTLLPYTALQGGAMLGTWMMVVCAGVEISGFCFDASGNYSGLYIGDGYRYNNAWSGFDSMQCNVHDNVFKYGKAGLVYDGNSSDQLCHDNIFYKQTDAGIYIDEGGGQHSVRTYVYNNIFNGPEDYGVLIYDSANCRDHIIGPHNVFKDQLHGTTVMTAPVSSANATPTNAIVGNWMACTNDHALGTHDIGSGNFVGLANTSEHVAED